MLVKKTLKNSTALTITCKIMLSFELEWLVRESWRSAAPFSALTPCANASIHFHRAARTVQLSDMFDSSSCKTESYDWYVQRHRFNLADGATHRFNFANTRMQNADFSLLLLYFALINCNFLSFDLLWRPGKHLIVALDTCLSP